ncbi:hypothetical protein D3C78_1308740 [compost metagenome]
MLEVVVPSGLVVLSVTVVVSSVELDGSGDGAEPESEVPGLVLVVVVTHVCD